LILLDTHAFVWLADDPSRLGETARRALAEDAEPAISAISAYEIAYLSLRGRLEFDLPVGTWTGEALGAHGVEVIPLTTAIALRAGSLDRESFPGDPADRIIYATALEAGARLVSRDERITGFDPARVVW
jgi:PIN domain nuclease of toxin-antitoxin system